MKKYALYPGVGRITPDRPLGYISGRQLAHCYRVPYSECLDTDIPAIKKVISMGNAKGAPPVHLIHLIPNAFGRYRIPKGIENRIIVAKGFHEAVNKNG
jgi:hypothetical protein